MSADSSSPGTDVSTENNPSSSTDILPENTLKALRSRIASELSKYLIKIQENTKLTSSAEWTQLSQLDKEQEQVSAHMSLFDFVKDKILSDLDPNTVVPSEMREVIEKLENLSGSLNQFKAKLPNSEQLRKEIIENLSTQMDVVNSALDLIETAKTLEDFKKVVMPNKAWLDEVPQVPDATPFVEEWKELKLESEVNKYVHQLILLLDSLNPLSLKSGKTDVDNLRNDFEKL